MNANLEDLSKEIEDLENELFNTPNEGSIENKAESVVEPATSTLASEIETLKVDLAASIKRFNNYKGSTDATIHDLRNQLAASKKKYVDLQQDYSKVVKEKGEMENSSAKSSIFSDEDRDILGESAVESISKGVDKMLESKIKPLQEEVEKSKRILVEKEAQEADQLARMNYTSFLEKIGKVVPDYAQINVDPGFISWLKEVDEVSGYPRDYLFSKAEQALDAGRVVSFFKEYEAVASTPNKVLEDNITPTGSPTPSAPKASGDSDKLITRAFIDKFYNDLVRGKYKGKKGREEADRIEAMIDQAAISGRII